MKTVSHTYMSVHLKPCAVAAHLPLSTNGSEPSGACFIGAHPCCIVVKVQSCNLSQEVFRLRLTGWFVSLFVGTSKRCLRTDWQGLIPKNKTLIL